MAIYCILISLLLGTLCAWKARAFFNICAFLYITNKQSHKYLNLFSSRSTWFQRGVRIQQLLFSYMCVILLCLGSCCEMKNSARARFTEKEKRGQPKLGNFSSLLRAHMVKYSQRARQRRKEAAGAHNTAIKVPPVYFVRTGKRRGQKRCV